MKHLEIRKRFVDFFKGYGHVLVEPSSIIPADDPTLLFTNAGMNQFKETLLGREIRSYTRCISIQPCMRVGGKHNDLDNVGKDGRHNTWFEMLGNWSFGDYSKEEAIHFAWELVTRDYCIDPRRIYVSVYKDDEEAVKAWKKVAGFSGSRIVRLGDISKGNEDSFWSMAPTGPCGPCTELFFDQGKSIGDDVIGGNTDRYLEFWNLVFMEFDRQEDGSLQSLEMKSVDTGMGLERIAAILQGKTNIFHSDLFMRIIDNLQELTGREFDANDASSMCVIVDHLRALTFVLADHGQFDRAGRGYVLRRILRRAVLHANKLGVNKPCLYHLVPAIIKTTSVYNVPKEQQGLIQSAIFREEEQFFKTIDRGLAYYRRAAEEIREGGRIKMSGKTAFKLYDTYGFPIDLTRILAQEDGIGVDMDGFDRELELQRTRSKVSQEFYDSGGWIIVTKGKEYGFAGYGLEILDVQVRRFRIRDDGLIDLVLDRTPFYIEGGGEIADIGTLSGPGVKLKVIDVKRTDVGVVHSAEVIHGDPRSLKDIVSLHAQVDIVWRYGKSAHHTATHLLHAALRSIYGSSVRQMGSSVTDTRLRFDFAHDRGMTDVEIAEVETMVNQWILQNEDIIQHLDVPLAEAQKLGALSFFKERYGERGRIIEISDLSTELCGGNHVRRTSEIGSFQILSEQSIAAGIRRIEAVAHLASVRRTQELRRVLQIVTNIMNSTFDQLPNQITHLDEELKKLKRANAKLLRQHYGIRAVVELLEEGKNISGVFTLVKCIDAHEDKALRMLLDNLRSRRTDGLFVLFYEKEKRGALAVGAGTELITKRGIEANKIARQIGKLLGAGGGGRSEFAQARFKHAEAKHVTDVIWTVIHETLKPRL